MNNLYTQISILLLALSFVSLHGQNIDEPNTTVYIYEDNNNNGIKEPSEPYLSGFTLDVTGFDGQTIEFTETQDGVFKGYVANRARVVVNGYTDEKREGNVGPESNASVFFAEPKGQQVNYYVAISGGPNIDLSKQNIILPCYEGGPAAGNKGPALIEYGFLHDGVIEKLGGSAPNPTALASVEEIGATWGVGMRHKANIVYVSALLKRHVGLGPQGLAGLYQYDLNTSTLSSYDLQGLPTTNGGSLDFGSLQRKTTDGDIAHDGSDDFTLTSKDLVATYDIDAFAKVGKGGIGDIDVSEDEETLWLVNLYDRSLVSIDVSSGQPDFTNIQSFPIIGQSGLPNLMKTFVRNFNVGGQAPGGAEAFTDPLAVAWEHDKYANGGQTGQSQISVSGTLDGAKKTTESSLYNSYRTGTNFSYQIPILAPGNYTVRLHFAETNQTYDGSNVDRTFTVVAEEANVLSDYTIRTAAGGMNIAHVEEFVVEVNDGVLDLEFIGQMVGQSHTPAIVSGIQIIGEEDNKILSGELRPWGLNFHEGKGYLGMVADANYSKAKDHLMGYIVSFDPNNVNGGFHIELEFPLKYPRERNSYADANKAYPLRTAVWEAWVDTWEETGIETSSDTMNVAYPQPIISDIDFDAEGNIVIGVMGRWGHQTGFLNYPPVSGDQTYLIGYAGGDILKAVPNVTRNGYNYILEPTNNDNIPYFKNDDGPNFNGEFFYDDFFESPRASHGELFTGGMGVMPGVNEVVLTVFNPIVTQNNPNFVYNGVFTQGTHVYSTITGAKQRASLITRQYLSGKASGLGDLEFSLQFPNNCVGNYVWCDGNADGIQQADEKGIPNVKLYLIQIDEVNGNQLIDSTLTDKEGLYYFCDLQRNSDYIIKIDLNQSALEGFQQKASPVFQGDDNRLDSDGQDDLIPGCVIAEVRSQDQQFNFSYDFGLLGPESQDVTRTICLDPGSTTAVFDLCEIAAAVKGEGGGNTIVEFYKTEADARSGENSVTRTGDCGYESSGEMLVAKVHIEGDELCYSLSKVTLVTSEAVTDIQLMEIVCPGVSVDLEQLIDLNQDSTTVYTLDPDARIQNINSFEPAQLPIALLFNVSFDNGCDASGFLTLNTVPPFEVEMEETASICEGDKFFFGDLSVRFPNGGSDIDQVKWTTSGTGTFNSGMSLSEAQSYTPSVQDLEDGYLEFYLTATNTCYEQRRTAYVEIWGEDDIRVDCLPSDTVSCFDPRIEDPYNPDFPKPSAVVGCDRLVSPELTFVDIEMDHCDSTNEFSSRIIRHWEFKFKDHFSTFCYDTIYVLQLPQMTPDAFVGIAEDSFYCELEEVFNKGEIVKEFASWKQPIGLHDYEIPQRKLGGVTYELPQVIIEAGLENAWSQGQSVYQEYLECVIMRKADGTEITIGDIVSGDYMVDLINNSTPTQRGYGFLQALIELNQNPVQVDLGDVNAEYYPYLLLEYGDWILSESGHFEKVDDEWFYNGNGNTPYWFAGGWPSIYGNGDCISYCDSGIVPLGNSECIGIKVPLYENPDGCDTICLSRDGEFCGISIEKTVIGEWTGQCPQTRSVDTWISQTCWSNVPNRCADDRTANESNLVASYDSSKVGVKVHLSQWQTFVDTLGPIFDFCYPTLWDHTEIKSSIRKGVISSEALAWERNNPTIYNAGTHSCEAEIFVPNVKVIDNCSGVHSVKAMVDVKGRTRAVALEHTETEVKILDSGDTCFLYTYSHISDPIVVPYSDVNGGLHEVRYEAADNCWNQSTWSKFVKVKDYTPPTVVANRELNFSLQNKKGWMNAIDIDEGSWDNCGDVLVLGRRVDWEDFCVELCTEEVRNATTLEDLNKIDPFSVLDSGEVELYYRNQIDWLKEDEACGEVLVEGWKQGIRKHWAENCGPKDEHGNPLISVPQNFLGGGWSQKIPFGCEDACQTVMVEILVMDQWCNWSKSWATVYVEDAVPAKKLITLDDITLTCDAYAKYYKPVLDIAEDAGHSDNDQAVFDHLDNLLGGYTAAWENNAGQPTDMDGNILPHDFSVINTVCEDSVKEIQYQDTLHDDQIVWRTRNISVAYLDDIEEEYTNGYVGVNCNATIRQDIWPDLNDCGVGNIMRKFYVTTGCGDKEVTTTYTQNITIEATCGLKKEMVSWPEDIEVCMPLTYDTKGNVNLPESIVGKAEYTFTAGCRMMALGYTDKVMDVTGNPKMKKIYRTYTAMDWCTGESVEHEQRIVLSDTCNDTGTGGTVISGTITDPNENFIRNVTLNMDGGYTTTETYSVTDGKYFMNISGNPDLLYLEKESSYRNGISTLDLIWMQRYLRDPSVFYSPYQKIAADVNNNGFIEPVDLVQIRNLILGKTSSFVQVKPWVFVDKRTQKAFSELKTGVVYQENNWVGVKMGDVNFDSDYLIRRTSRSVPDVYPLTLERVVTNNGRVQLRIKATEAIHIAGLQLSLDMPSSDFWKMEASSLELNDNNWNTDGKQITISWTSKNTHKLLEEDEVLFILDLGQYDEKQKPGSISLNSSFNSEIYTSDLNVKKIGLKHSIKREPLEHKIYPNPANQNQIIEMNSPVATDAIVVIQSADGKEVERFDMNIRRGLTVSHHLLSDQYKSGVYFYQIRTKSHVVTGRFEVIR